MLPITYILVLYREKTETTQIIAQNMLFELRTIAGVFLSGKRPCDCSQTLDNASQILIQHCRCYHFIWFKALVPAPYSSNWYPLYSVAGPTCP
jgi:hypothetical protein